jgi:uncharacterized protein YkwD
MRKILSHWFIPHQSNNHRAKLLHHSSILGIILLLFVLQFAFSYIRTDYPAVLGSSIDLSTEQLVKLTNQEREKQHLQQLRLNDTLSKAAALKAEYMFAHNFWAHNGPDGTTPWYFFKQVGYNYTYAGENLARGFTNSSEVMTAWMNSPTHKENILSPNYDEIGFAVKKGKLLGEDTTLIVEMFGSTSEMPLAEKSEEQVKLPEHRVLPAADEKNTQLGYNYDIIKTTSLLSSRMVTSHIAFLIIGIFILGLFIDMIVVYRKKIIRVVGHNMDHIFFFAAILLVVIFSTTGVIV